MFKNTAGQKVTLYAVDVSTGLPKTGDAANMLCYVSKDDGTVTLITSNSGVPTEKDATNAKGAYDIALSQAETNADKLFFSAKSTTANVVLVPQTIYTLPANFTSFTTPPTTAQIATGVWQDATSGDFTVASSIGKSLYTSGVVPGASGGLFIAGSNAATTVNITGNITGTVSTVTTVTNQLTAAQIATGVWQDATAGDFTTASSIGKSLYTSGVVPGASGGLFIAGTNAVTTVNITGNITGNLSGSVGSVTGNVGGNVTGTVASVVGNVGGNVVGTVASVVGNVGGNVTGTVALSASGLDAVVLESGLNARQGLSIIAASQGGVVAGGGTTTVTIAAAGVPATNRITATVDSSGNRTAVTLNPPA